MVLSISLNISRLIEEFLFSKEFYIFLQAVSVTDLNTKEDKLGWIFTAFDQDGGGYIDVDEIRDIVTCLFR